MGRLFRNRARRDTYIAALTFLLEQVDDGTRTPKQAIQVIANQVGRTPIDVAAEIAARTESIALQMKQRLEDVNQG